MFDRDAHTINLKPGEVMDWDRLTGLVSNGVYIGIVRDDGEWGHLCDVCPTVVMVAWSFHAMGAPITKPPGEFSDYYATFV